MTPGAPMLWGIDPDLIFRWAPISFREPPKGFEKDYTEAEKKDAEALKKAAATNPEAANEKKHIKAVIRKYAGQRWGIPEGAPILHLAPLSEKTAQSLHAAKALYTQMLTIAREELDANKTEIDKDKELSAEAKKVAKAALDLEARKENVKRGLDAYDSDLRSRVLSESVKGWENFRKPFSNDWSKDSLVLPMTIKDEAFDTIAEGAIFTGEEEEGFTLRLGSGVA